ncbi:MAG: hypothetical protein ABIN89_01700 [Chitinophagaceae bacterium]
MQRTYKSGLLPVLIFCSLLHANAIIAQGDLLIFPRRVVFEGSKRSEQLNLSNTGNDTATYLISFVQIRMKPDGGFEKITMPDSGQQFSDQNIRYFPRSVTLAPRESQTVKLQLTKTNQLTPGEYRSHLYFRAVPKEPPLGEKPLPTKDSTISIKLIPIYGLSIAVIIRNGEATTMVNFSDLTFNRDKELKPYIALNFNRSGNMSTYGDVTVDYIAIDGKVTQVGVANGLAVYTPNTTRHFQLLLDNKSGIDYSSGKLHVTYSSQIKKIGKLAEEEIVLR